MCNLDGGRQRKTAGVYYCVRLEHLDTSKRHQEY